MPDDRLLQTDIKNTVCMLATELDADFINNIYVLQVPI